jgi:hypothetical protein
MTARTFPRIVDDQIHSGPAADRQSKQIELRLGQLDQSFVQPLRLVGRVADWLVLDAHARFTEQVDRVDRCLLEQAGQVVGPHR